MAEACLDPTVTIPAAARERLAAFVPSLLKETLWSHTSVTADDFMLEACEPTLCAVAPEQLAAALRHIARWFATREGQPLQSLYWGVRHHHLVFGNEEWRAVARAWEQVMSTPQAWTGEPGDSRDRTRDLEADVFGLFLNALSPMDQLRSLLRRPASARDRLSFEPLFDWPPDWDEVRNLLGGSPSTSALFRILWFLSSRPNEIPKALMDQVDALSRHDDARIRFMALAILGRTGSPSHIEAFLETGWHAAAAQHEWEKHAGSWIWATRAQNRPFQQVRARMELRHLASAVPARGFRRDEVEEYATALGNSLGLGPPPPVLPPYSVTRPEVRDDGRPTLLDVTVAPEDIEIRTGDPEILRQAFDVDAQLARDAQLRQAVVDADVEQRRAGNPWFAEGPPVTALEAVVRHRPDLAKQWVAAALSPDEGHTLLLRHGGFLQELCVALLKTLPEQGLRLRNGLREARGLGLIRDARTDTSLVDLALWEGVPVSTIGDARRQIIVTATSDLELFQVALAAEDGGQTDWLCQEFRRLLSSDRLMDQARAVTLAAFMSDSEGWRVIEAQREGVGRSWVDRVVDLGRDRHERDRYARYWFQRFTTASDDVSAWAAFRLFLRCVDRRFCLWRTDVEQRAPAETYSNRRKRFLLFEEGWLEKVVKRNEDAWKKTFLGSRVLDREVWPWLS